MIGRFFSYEHSYYNIRMNKFLLLRRVAAATMFIPYSPALAVASRRILSSLSTDSASKLDILRCDRHALRVNAA